MGSTAGKLPSALQFTGQPFSEMVLIAAAYDYEQVTRYRTPPATFPTEIRASPLR